MKKSLRTRLSLIMIGLGIIPLLIAGIVLSFLAYSFQRNEVLRHQREVTKHISLHASDFINQLEKRIETTARILGAYSGKEEQQRIILTTLESNNINELAIIDRSGRQVFRESRVRVFAPGKMQNMSREVFFQTALEKKSTYFGPVRFDRTSHEPLMTIAAPILEPHRGTMIGVLFAEIRLKSIWSLIEEEGSLHGDHITFIVDRMGDVIAHPNPSLVLQGIHWVDDRISGVRTGISGRPVFFFKDIIHFGSQQFIIVTEHDLAHGFSFAYTTVILISIIVLTTLGMSTVLIFYSFRSILIPINGLINVVNRMRHGDLTARAEVIAEDEIGMLSASFNQMTDQLNRELKERRRAEETLRDSEKRFRALVENATDGFFLISTDGRILGVNQQACVSLGHTREELVRLFIFDIDPDLTPEDFNSLTRRLKYGEAVNITAHHRKKNGSSFPVEIRIGKFETGGTDYLLALARDITEREMLESQLKQAQKMEAIGRLSGGVAHDFNNMLTTILGYAQMLQMDLPESDPMRETIDSIYAAGIRAADLTRQLLAFSRKQVMEMTVVNLNSVINNMAKMLGRLIGEDVELVLNVREDLCNIKADPGQIEQIIMNLAINARDAMPGGGRLVFETANISSDQKNELQFQGLAPGDYALLGVTDTGKGMPPEIRESIFDPFFTTKSQGEGTGLGLATVYGIVKQHGGYIFVKSQIDRGTTFQILFPSIDEEVEIRTKPTTDKMAHGAETVLVVDDEPTVRRLVIDTLRSLDYHVLEAENAMAAITQFENANGQIDLLLTDVIMPGMNGRDLAARLLHLYPRLKVLYMSGYTDNIIARQGVLKPGVHFLPKPLVPTALASKIRMILDEEQSEGSGKSKVSEGSKVSEESGGSGGLESRETE